VCVKLVFINKFKASRYPYRRGTKCEPKIAQHTVLRKIQDGD
jgi:hypothetical protein